LYRLSEPSLEAELLAELLAEELDELLELCENEHPSGSSTATTSTGHHRIRKVIEIPSAGATRRQ
jgi:hypothetical protein